MLAIEKDRQQPHDEVVVGSKWFAWKHHWTIKREREVAGVREVLMHRVTGERKNTEVWVPAWRVQRYGTPSQA